MIVLPNIDGKIWNIEYRVADMIAEINGTGKLTIDLNSEGPCAQELGLYDILNYICQTYNYSKSVITIITCNQLEKHNEYHIIHRPPLYIESAQIFAQQHTCPEKTFDDNFKHFGIFIGRSNWLRLYLASYLNRHYKSITQMTFHYTPNLNFHQDHLGINDLINFYPTTLETLQPTTLINQCPIVDDAVETYPILTPAHFNISKIYHKFFVEIVCETYSQGQTFYPTEKIWRPIIMRTPFIVQGPLEYIENLHKLGFKTFNQWWDESHSQDAYSYQPIAICNILDSLGKLTVDELNGLYIDMQDTLNHNYDTMMSLSPWEILKVFK